MADSMEVIMLKQRLEDLRHAANMQRSAQINLLIDIKVTLEEDDTEGALEIIKEALGE